MSEVISNAFENQQTVTPVKKDVEPSYPYLVYESQQDLDRLEAALTELRKTKTGAQLIADATEHKTPIRLNGAMRAYGSYDEVTNDLKINANNDENRMVGTLAHELRHAQQFQKGILLDAYLDTPKTYIQNQAAIEADASATSCADATEHKTPIRLNGAMRAYGSYDEVTNDLKINANNDENRMVGTLAHELRHAQQFQKGILLDAYLDTPKTYIQNQAAIEADASAVFGDFDRAAL